MKNKLILKKEDILDLLDKEYHSLCGIISDKFGIVNAILERKELLKYDLYMYQCLSANASVLFNLDREVSSGGLGISETRTGAIISCLAESIERYCMSFIPKDELIYAKKDELDKSKTFESFATYNEKQYQENRNFTNPYKDKIHWTKIYSINNPKKYMYYPASLIYLPFSISLPVAENTSTGMSAGFSIEDCITSGLLELLERDALMINFLQRLNPLEIDIETIDGNNKELINKIKEEYNIKIYRLYSDIKVPIYLAYIWQEEGKKVHYGIGACAHFDSDYAINKALKECLFTHFYSKNIIDARVDNPKEIKALYEHFLYYQGDKFKELLFTSKVVKYKKEKTNLKKVLENLKEKGLEVYYKELTTADIKPTKLKVVKVIVPGLIDLNKTHLLPRLGAERFWSVPKNLGLKYGEVLDNKPHPFP